MTEFGHKKKFSQSCKMAASSHVVHHHKNRGHQSAFQQNVGQRLLQEKMVASLKKHSPYVLAQGSRAKLD
jgi:hypothetical protein